MIESMWNLGNFERDLTQALFGLDSVEEPEIDFDALSLRMGSVVRSLDVATGRCLSDYGSSKLAPAAMQAVRQLLGQRCGSLAMEEMERVEREFGVFASGVLRLCAVDDQAPSAANAD